MSGVSIISRKSNSSIYKYVFILIINILPFYSAFVTLVSADFILNVTSVSADPIQYLENRKIVYVVLRSISLIGEELCPSRFSLNDNNVIQLDIFPLVSNKMLLLYQL